MPIPAQRDLEQSVRRALQSVHGSYAIAVVSRAIDIFISNFKMEMFLGFFLYRLLEIAFGRRAG